VVPRFIVGTDKLMPTHVTMQTGRTRPCEPYANRVRTGYVGAKLFLELLAGAFIVSASASALAAPANDHLRGVWGGTLGAAKVTACFGMRPADQEVVGSYYDAKYQEPLALLLSDNGQTFEETGGPIWSLAASGRDELSGTWHKNGSDRQLPVRLTRMSGTIPGDDCGSDAFLRPVVAHVMQLTAAKPELLGDRRYRPLSLAGVQLVELIDSSPGAVVINRQLRAELAVSAADEAAIREKARDSIRSLGIVALDKVSSSVIEWNDRWMTLNLNREFAGFGAAGVDSGYRSWDMRSGREIDPWTWFGLKSREGNDEPLLLVTRTAILPGALKRIVLKAATTVRECRALYRGPLSARIWAGAAGIEFTIGDTDRPECLQSVVLPIAAVRSLMTPAGRDESKRIFGN
jgi:hypothetical protein